MQLAQLFVHPVKSTAAQPVSRAYAERSGLRGDREWMVVDDDGVLVTARELPALLRIRAVRRTDAVGLDLRAVGAPAYILRQDTRAPSCSVRMFDRPPLTAIPAGPEADAWLHRVLGRTDLHLVWCDDPTRRTLNPAWTQPGDHARFPDNSPVSLVTTSSLAQVQDWIAGDQRHDEQSPRPTAGRSGQPGPLDVRRFRPNLVVSGAATPFAEDGWSRIQVGDVAFRVARPIDRCTIPMTDPDSLARSKEPIRTLARHRRWDGKTWLCVHMLPDGEGELRVGDRVRVLA